MTQQRRLPQDYYLDHFAQVLEGVTARYDVLLTPDERAHIARLRALTPSARMLYARLVNRRGPCFRINRLHYPEIVCLADALSELLTQNLLELCEPSSEQLADAGVLACFTLTELRLSLRGHAIPAAPRKPDLLAWLAAWEHRAAWLASLLAADAVIRVPKSDPWPFLRFLFFGELRDNLSDFVTRALGHIVTESFQALELAPHFTSRAAARDAFRMASLYAAFRHIRATRPPEEILAWWRAQSIDRATLAAGRDWFDRLTERLGRLLERANLPEAALELYAATPSAPCRERRARLLLKAGRTAEALTLLHAIRDNPCHGEEAYAVRQLLARLERSARRSDARALERAATTLTLGHTGATPEAALLAHYRAAGWHGAHTENWLWNAAFGLLLWDIIYDPTLGVFHSPLQFAPSDLHDASFYTRRQPAIAQRLTLLENPEAALALIRRHIAAKSGLANPFVAWHEGLPPLLEIMLRRLPPAGLAAALRRIAQDVTRHARGLPDLFLWTETEYRFVEVKSENDHLSPHQYEWLTFLEHAGINVVLVKIQPEGRQDKDSRK